MNKIIVLVVVCSVISGCGWFDRKMAAATGGATKTCVDGVQYLQFTSGSTVAYNTDGSIKTCKE